MTTTGRTKAKPAKSTSVSKATAKNSATKSAVRKSPAKEPTSGSLPASGKGAVSPRSAEVKEARRFALSHNFGLSSRIRDLLDSKRPVLQIFIDENLPLARIQEFIHRKYGPKIPAKALGTYLDANFKAKK